MTISALGSRKDSLLLFGGPYSNLQATQAIREQAMRLDIPADNIICTGDVVAYCAQPNETVALIREWGIAVVMGNCEESIGNNAADCGCGFEANSTCAVLADSWYNFTNSCIDKSHRQWMRTLPHQINFSFSDKNFSVVHGNTKQINQFIFASDDEAQKAREIIAANVDGIVGGHCGIPFTQIIENKLWHNPGVIGMPANDGTAQVWYSTWRTKGEKIHIEHHRLDYDANAAASAMYDVGLSREYAASLTTGIWPSVDILPARERGQQGEKIRESTHFF